MKVKVKIGPYEHDLDEVDEHQIVKELVRLRKDNGAVCVRVTIKDDGVDLRLDSGACSVGGGGGRRATRNEKEILELWDKLGLNERDIAPGQINAFLKQIAK